MKHNIELQPFRVPNYVMQVTKPRPRQEGWQESPKYHLSELSEETLNAMCAEFREGVFEKARAGDPD